MSLRRPGLDMSAVAMRRAGTVRAADGLNSAIGPMSAAVNIRRNKGYDAVHQGLKQLHPPPDQATDVKPDMDIVLIPGMGAHPEDCWKSAKTGWNWTTNEDGIIKDFPRARVLLYMYDSAWIGNLKVKNYISNIAMSLLICLRSLRDDCKTRPIALIGHSMGGLVVAKAVTYAESRNAEFPLMFEAISATVFFGTPFGGATAASAAAMFAPFAEWLGQANASKLLDFMAIGSEALRELKDEFTRLVAKLDRQIHVLCFWETHPTDITDMVRLPSLFAYAKVILPKTATILVTDESATLFGLPKFSISSNHRDLVKFQGPRDKIWAQLVRENLKITLGKVHLTAKNRLAVARGLDWSVHKGITEALGGIQIEKKRKEIAKKVTKSSWITETSEYSQWLGSGVGPSSQTLVEEPPSDYLWIRGREGRGKTGAAMAVISVIESHIKDFQDKNPEQDGPLMAYFFCESTADFSTAEDLLKSVLSQLISQQTALASHAKVFNKTNRGKKDKDPKDRVDGLQPTLENLWQTLQSMLSDELVGPRVYLVINNLHVLPRDSDSTEKLMDLLRSELSGANAAEKNLGGWRVPVRWFFTSREAHHIGEVLNTPIVRLVDLEDEKYGDKVQLELRKHAKDRVAELETQKSYTKALVYYAGSLIGKRARSTHWIDITCVQLEQLPEGESQLRIRRKLEKTPQDLGQLLKEAWSQVFTSAEDRCEEIKEMLRALILTFEEPTVQELGILAGLPTGNREELEGLIERCKPLLVVKRTVGFMNAAVKTHLYENAEQVLGLSEEAIRWHHGVLALQCLAHLKDSFGFEFEQAEEAVPTAVDGWFAPDEGREYVPTPHTPDAEVAPWKYGTFGVPPGFPPAVTFNATDQSGEAQNGDEDGNSSSDEEDSSDGYEYDYHQPWEAEDEADQDPEATASRDKALAYPVKHWLHHSGKATAEFADDLSRDDFWDATSPIRRRWLMEYMRMTNDFEFNKFDPRSLTPLHVASSVGYRQLVVSLVKNGHRDELQVYDLMEFKPLHLAAAFGRCNIVQELIDMDTPIDDAWGDEGDTPLHMAARGGHVAVMKKLILQGANPNKYSRYLGSVISVAISSGKIEAVQLLAERGVTLISQRDDVESALVQAAARSDISMFEYLLHTFGSSLPPDEYSKALSSAAGAGRVDILNRLLLQRGYTQQDFQYALQSAAEDSKWDTVNMILDACERLNCDEPFLQASKDPESKIDVMELLWLYSAGTISRHKLNESLYHAADMEKLDTVRVLLERYGADANATGHEYGNALTAASFDGRLDIVQLLLHHGAVIDSPDGWPLQAAAGQGQTEVVEELLKRGANVNALSERYSMGTAIQAATEGGQKDIVAMLLEHGADPNLGSGDDAPPIVAAAIYCQPEILNMLVDKRADVNVWGAGEEKTTPLIEAAGYIPGTDSLRKLIDAGADVNAVNAAGETALIVAAGEGDENVVEFLLNEGADILHTTKAGKNALVAAMEADPERDAGACVKVLVDHVSKILSALEKAIAGGNAAVTAVVRTATARELDYGEGQQSVETQVPFWRVAYAGEPGPGIQPPPVEAAPVQGPPAPMPGAAQPAASDYGPWETKRQLQPHVQEYTPPQHQQATPAPGVYGSTCPYPGAPTALSQPPQQGYPQQPASCGAIERTPVTSTGYSTPRAASPDHLGNLRQPAARSRYQAYNPSAQSATEAASTGASASAAVAPPPPPIRPLGVRARSDLASSHDEAMPLQDISLCDGGQWSSGQARPDTNPNRSSIGTSPYHAVAAASVSVRRNSSPPRPFLPHSYSAPAGGGLSAASPVPPSLAVRGGQQIPPAQDQAQPTPAGPQWPPAQPTYAPLMAPIYQGQNPYGNQVVQQGYNAYQGRP